MLVYVSVASRRLKLVSRSITPLAGLEKPEQHWSNTKIDQGASGKDFQLNHRNKPIPAIFYCGTEGKGLKFSLPRTGFEKSAHTNRPAKSPNLKEWNVSVLFSVFLADGGPGGAVLEM